VGSSLGPRSVWLDGLGRAESGAELSGRPDRRHQLGSARPVSMTMCQPCPCRRYFCVLGNECSATRRRRVLPCIATRPLARSSIESKGLPVITTQHITRQMSLT